MGRLSRNSFFGCFILSALIFLGCGRTSGNIIAFNQSLLSTGSGLVSGLFAGAVGKTTSSTGTCVGAGIQSAFCTGGNFTWGSSDGAYQDTPSQIAIDSVNGFSYIADTTNNRVVKINTSTGAFIGAMGTTSSSSGTCPSSGVTGGFCTGGQFTSGSGDGMFNVPQGIAVDPVNGFLYVSDGYYRIQKFILSSGVFVGAIGYVTSSSGTCPGSGAASGWCTGGTFGSSSADGAYFATSIAIDVAGDKMYVVNSFTSAVNKVTLSTGAFVGSVGYTGSSTGTCPTGETNGWCTGGSFLAGTTDGAFNFGSNSSIALDTTHDYFYVVDDYRAIVLRFTLSTGVFAGAVGKTTASTGTCPASGVASSWCTGGTFGSGNFDGAFYQPYAIAVDATNNILYVGDFEGRIVKMNLTTGAFIGAVGKTTASTGTCPIGTVATSWCTGGTFTNSTVADGAYTVVYALAVDPTSGRLMGTDGFRVFVLQ